MVYAVLLLLSYACVYSATQNIRTRLISVNMDTKFQCTDSACSSHSILPGKGPVNCQFACLADPMCQITSFDQTTSACQLFRTVSSAYGNLTAQTGVITTFALDCIFVSNDSAVSGCTNTEVTPSGRGRKIAFRYCRTHGARLAPTLGWLFENDLNDRFGVFNGTSRNGPLSYGNGRHGCGKCLNLTNSLRQSAIMNQSAFINLRNTSFSIETWIKPSRVGDGIEHVIFSQCPTLSVRYCIRTSIAGSGAITTAFYGDNRPGTRILTNNTWTHVASVYNYTAQSISLYVNGTLDVTGGPHGPIQATPSPIEIGNIALYEPTANISFSGCIDELWFYPFARTASEIAATVAQE